MKASKGIASYIDEFLNYLEVELNRSPRTVSGYRKDLQVFFAYLAGEGRGDGEISQITIDCLRGYLQYLVKELGYRPNTVRRHGAALKSFFGFLYDCEYIENDPAADLVRPRVPERQPVYLYREEVERLFAAVPEGPGAPRRDKTILITLFYTGARVLEVVNLLGQDIDFEEKWVRINSGKGGKFRRVPLHPVLEKQLANYMGEARIGPDEHLFTNRQGGQVTTEYIRQITKEYARSAGIKKKVTPHVLRHSYATLLYRTGEVDIFTLSKLLGHSGLKNTTVYIHSDIQHLRKALERLPVFPSLKALFHPRPKQALAEGGALP